jgi:hypothetical protein
LSERLDPVVITPTARLDIFGFRPTAAEVRLIPRTRSWRVSRSLGSLALCWCIIPIVALIPPHVPWALGAFVAGIFLSRKYASEHYTLLSMRGTCPQCGNALEISKVQRLRTPNPMSCDECHQQVLLYVDV